MILTVAFIACTTGKLPQQSKKLRKNLKNYKGSLGEGRRPCMY